MKNITKQTMEYKMKKIIINDTDFSYNEELDYLKDGHIYCKKCNERIDSEPLDFSDKKFIFKVACKCVRDEEERRKKIEEQQKVLRLKEECFRTIKNRMDYHFDKKDSNTKEYQLARNYVKKFELMKKENIGLMFYGPVGSGKTTLAACIANAIIEKYKIRVKFRNIPQIINDIEKAGFNIDKNEYINSLTNVPLLVLDDFGIERNTEYTKELLYQIINARYESKKPTIISTNISIDEITCKNIEINLKRIYLRIMEMCTPVKVMSNDKRLKENLRKTEIVKKELFI